MNRNFTLNQVHFGHFIKNISKIESTQAASVVIFFHPDGSSGIDQQNFSFHKLKNTVFNDKVIIWAPVSVFHSRFRRGGELRSSRGALPAFKQSMSNKNKYRLY